MGGLLLKLSLLVATLCVLQVYGYEEDDYKRALEAFRLLHREPERQEQQVRALECKKEGEGCRLVPKCCGTLQCYWAEGISVKMAGECVKCVERDQLCQADSKCCAGTVCDKGNALWLDGRCVAPRTSGECYRNAQCAGGCSRKWYQIKGTCS